MIHKVGGHICMTSIMSPSGLESWELHEKLISIDLKKKVQKQSIRPELYGHCGKITFLLCGIFMGACMP